MPQTQWWTNERRRVLLRMLTESWGVPAERAEAGIDRWVTGSPLVRLELVLSG
jgi:hypothetical protein